MRYALTLLLIVAQAGCSRSVRVDTEHDWPQWGRNASRNMVAPHATSLPATWEAGEPDNHGGINPQSTTNIKWIAQLGSQSFGNMTVSGGRIYLGTNNDYPRDNRFKGDHSLVYCLDEKTGDLLWQFTATKCKEGKVTDWEHVGICSSPAVDGDRVYFITNRTEVVCVDVNGMANGNDGYQNEGQYMVGLDSQRPPLPIAKTDADIIWRFDMRDELGIFPHNMTASSVLIVGDYLFANTNNGVHWTHSNIPNFKAPSLVCLNKKTGKLIGEEISAIGTRIMHGSWSSPAFGEVDGKGYVFFGGPDGWLYCFEVNPIPDPDDGTFKIFKEVWRFDGNLSEFRFDAKGKPKRYVRPDGPSEYLATPVFHDGYVYIGIGQDPMHGEGVGNFDCIDVRAALQAVKHRDISIEDSALQPAQNFQHPLDVTAEARRWNYTGINRTMSTASVIDGMVYIADYAGYVHCLDAETGELYWIVDTLSHIWGSTLVADGKVYVGNEDGILTVLKHGHRLKAIDTSILSSESYADTYTTLKERGNAQVMAEIEMPASLYCSPVYANGVLYIMSGSHLWAIQD